MQKVKTKDRVALRACLSFCALFLLSCNNDQTPTQVLPVIPASYEASGWTAKTLPELSHALESGEITSEALVKAFVARIEAVDREGPDLQAVLTLNPDYLDIAKTLDSKRESGEELGALHGIPVLLKDNIESQGNMATTAGSLALKDNLTGRNSPLVQGLRDAGAIILGKTNLSEWANFRSNQSMSGWSGLGGQTRNPHMLDRNPCGSSSGSGSAVAASLAAGAVGTETNGSIICPSNVNGIVGFKPTVGLISQKYIVPISSTQDTAGPMTKTVAGAAMILSAMASGPEKTDYLALLDVKSLVGLRIGVLNFAKGSNPDIHEVFEKATEDLQNSGAVLVNIDDFEPRTDNFRAKSLSVLKYEFKAGLNDYLADTPRSVSVRSLEELIDFNANNAVTELALFGQDILKSSNEMGPLSDLNYIDARADVLTSARRDGIDALMREYNVDVLISPSGPLAGRIDPINGDVWPNWAGAGYLAAIAGYPHLTVPMGHVHEQPLGLSFIGARNDDARILSYGFAYEQSTKHLKEPKYLTSAETQADIRNAMQR